MSGVDPVEGAAQHHVAVHPPRARPSLPALAAAQPHLLVHGEAVEAGEGQAEVALAGDACVEEAAGAGPGVVL